MTIDELIRTYYRLDNAYRQLVSRSAVINSRSTLALIIITTAITVVYTFSNNNNTAIDLSKI